MAEWKYEKMGTWQNERMKDSQHKDLDFSQELEPIQLSTDMYLKKTKYFKLYNFVLIFPLKFDIHRESTAGSRD